MQEQRLIGMGQLKTRPLSAGDLFLFFFARNIIALYLHSQNSKREFSSVGLEHPDVQSGGSAD